MTHRRVAGMTVSRGPRDARRVQATTVPPGERVLDLLPDLRSALDGTGPALLPLGEIDPRAADIARMLGAGRPIDSPAADPTFVVEADRPFDTDDSRLGRRHTTATTRGSACDGGTGDTSSLRRGEPGRLGPDEDDPDDPTALVMPTSGSTGAPKGVLLSAHQLAASALATEQRLGGPGHWLLALPAHHIAGMQVLLRAARADTEPIVLDSEIPFTAANFVMGARRVPGPRRYVSLVPTQLRRVLADPASATATAEIFDAVLVGGAATPASLLESARAAGIPVVTTYGMTETCGGCVYNGVPLQGVSATVNHDGALVLSGPMIARGYRHRPGHPAFAVPGRFVTSDTGEVRPGARTVDAGGTVDPAGSVDSMGTVIVTGRLDDVIVTGGINVAPAPIEQAIAALPGAADALVVGVPDSEWGQAVTALIVAEPGSAAWTPEALRAALADLPAASRPRNVVMVDAIPQLASGKPDRAATRELAASRHPALGP